MIEKVLYLYQRKALFGGYMVTFIETMYQRVNGKSRFEVTFSHNEANFINRAYRNNGGA